MISLISCSWRPLFFVSTERQRRTAARGCCTPRYGRVSHGNQGSTASGESSAGDASKQCTPTNKGPSPTRDCAWRVAVERCEVAPERGKRPVERRDAPLLRCVKPAREFTAKELPPMLRETWCNTGHGVLFLLRPPFLPPPPPPGGPSCSGSGAPR